MRRMAWRFRKSFKVMPGLKLNVSRRGLSATIGSSPLSLNVGPKGIYGKLSIPGTGLGIRQRLDGTDARPRSRGGPVTPAKIPAAAQQIPQPPAVEIRSASTELLNSESMEVMRRLLKEAYEERDVLGQEVASADIEADLARRRYRSWERGFLFKKLFKQTFAARKDAHETAEAKRAELHEQFRLTTL